LVQGPWFLPLPYTNNKDATLTTRRRQWEMAVLCALLGVAGAAFGQDEQEVGDQRESAPQIEPGSPESFERYSDPTDFHTRFGLRDEYQSLESDASRNVVVARFEYALSKAFALRVDVPYVSVDPNQPGTSQESGLGDITARAQWRVLRAPEYALVMAAEVALDTATEPLLGTGRYIFQPLVYAAVGLPKYKSTVFPYVQQFWAFGGTTDVQINTTLLRSGFLTIWPKRIYTYAEPSLYIDWERNARTGATLEIELGRFVTRRLGLYVRPGVGLWGDIPPVYDWNFEVGLHYFFN
jgi:hypothetical protein